MHDDLASELEADSQPDLSTRDTARQPNMLPAITLAEWRNWQTHGT